MSDISEIRWEIDELIQRWKLAYPADIFPVLADPPTTNETLRAVMLARHILESLSGDIEDICITHMQDNQKGGKE